MRDGRPDHAIALIHQIETGGRGHRDMIGNVVHMMLHHMKRSGFVAEAAGPAGRCGPGMKIADKQKSARFADTGQLVVSRRRIGSRVMFAMTRLPVRSSRPAMVGAPSRVTIMIGKSR